MHARAQVNIGYMQFTGAAVAPFLEGVLNKWAERPASEQNINIADETFFNEMLASELASGGVKAGVTAGSGAPRLTAALLPAHQFATCLDMVTRHARTQSQEAFNVVHFAWTTTSAKQALMRVAHGSATAGQMARELALSPIEGVTPCDCCQIEWACAH